MGVIAVVGMVVVMIVMRVAVISRVIVRKSRRIVRFGARQTGSGHGGFLA
ncbi:hypothetical protein BCAR13_1230034 [Paraburkholderia caribensis]|nr:hypothetical protein BCAR13_1230034 [Paraburkholderia caribensis]